MIDFTIPAELAAERDRVRRFVIDKIIPFERDQRLTTHGPTEVHKYAIGRHVLRG